MKERYTEFRKKEAEKCNILAEKLEVSSEERQKIDDWFDYIIELHQNFRLFDEKTEIRVPDGFEKQLKLKEKAENAYKKLPKFSEQARKYLYTRAKSLYSITHTEFLKGNYIPNTYDSLLRGICSKTSEDMALTADELDWIADYLTDNLDVSFFVMIIEDLLDFEKKNTIRKKWTGKQRQNLLKNLLNVHMKIHRHNLATFKKILSFVEKEDTDVIQKVLQYKAEDRQGGMQIIEKILQAPLYRDIWEEFSLKRDIIKLFDGARGKEPKESWVNRYKIFEEKLGKEFFSQLGKQITALKHYKVLHYTDKNGVEWEKSASWVDEIAHHCLTAVEWYNNL